MPYLPSVEKVIICILRGFFNYILHNPVSVSRVCGKSNFGEVF